MKHPLNTLTKSTKGYGGAINIVKLWEWNRAKSYTFKKKNVYRGRSKLICLRLRQDKRGA